MQLSRFIFKFRDSCIYKWVNVNINFAEWNNLMFPKIHIFLFTEDEPIYTLPFSFHFLLYWKSFMSIRNRPYMTLKGSTLSNRGYERSEHPRIGLRRDACTLKECPNTPTGRPLQGRYPTFSLCPGVLRTLGYRAKTLSASLADKCG